MGKLIIFFFLFNFNIFGFSPENIFQDDLTLKDTLSFFQKILNNPLRNKKDFHSFLADPKNKVSDTFKVTKELRSRVIFWYDIYTKYNSHQRVLHDIDNLGLIYDAVDFSELSNNNLNKNTIFGLQNKFMEGVIRDYKISFQKLAKGNCSLEKCKTIVKALKKSKIVIPKSTNNRGNFFRNLSKKLRAQTGQKNHVHQGLLNISNYRSSINEIFSQFKLPKELLAISFLESSFNINAVSKVNATGPWQFMKHIGKYFLTISKYQDQRKSALLSTIGALHLLKQNKQILKRWDLAVNAYNSGTGLIRRGVKALKRRGIKKPLVQDLIRKFKNPNWGFAAKNFYAEFLAMVYSLAYKEEIFQTDSDLEKNNKVFIYLTKCKLPLLKVLRSMKQTKLNLIKFNNHLNKNIKYFPRSTVIISDTKLDSRKYLLIKPKEYAIRYPRKYYKLLKNQSCSIK